MNRLLLAATALVLVAGTACAADPLGDADPTVPVPNEGTATGPDWNQGLIWGLAGGGLGLVVLAGAAYFLGVGGLRHVDRHNVLEHPMRQSLLDVVEDEPGIHLRELASRHDTAVTNTQWHLRKLEMAGLVKTDKVQGRRLYYPTRGGVAAREVALQNAAVQNPNAQRILDFLQSHAGCNQRRLADHLRMNPGTVRWHLRKMESAGLVRGVDEGAQTHYFAAASAAPSDWRPARPVREVGAVEHKR